MKTISFIHLYPKLLDEHNDMIESATLLGIFKINLEDMDRVFLDYDTAEGAFFLPPRGKYLMLLFLKPHEGAWCTGQHLFTTLRRATPQKEAYYRALIGQPLRVLLAPKGGIDT